MLERSRPSFGRPRAVRGLDQFDTPPIALDPLWAHEPLLAGVTEACEPFCGKGNLVSAMRARGLIVHASDIVDRGCPDSTVLDFRKMTRRPCDVLLSNCAYADAMGHIEHAWALGFRVVVLLLKLSFLSTTERYERLHKRGHLRRVHVLAERLQDMHDANYTGKKASQSQSHAWFVFDRDYCGRAEINAVSIHQPDALFFRESMVRLMRSLDYVVEAFSSARDFLSSPRFAEAACLITDVHMPAMTGD